MTHVTQLGWQLRIYPNELNVESMHDHQLLGNDTEPNNYTQLSNGCLDAPTFVIAKVCHWI